MNYVWKANDREAEGIVLLIFVLWRCFNDLWVRSGGVDKKSYSGSAEIASFSKRDFSRFNKHDTFWHVASTGYFNVLFLWAVAVSDFRPLDIYKNLGFPLSEASNCSEMHCNKKVLLKISEISQQNICVRISFLIKLYV